MYIYPIPQYRHCHGEVKLRNAFSVIEPRVLQHDRILDQLEMLKTLVMIDMAHLPLNAEGTMKMRKKIWTITIMTKLAHYVIDMKLVLQYEVSASLSDL